MKIIRLIIVPFWILLLVGCASSQQVTKLQKPPRTVCIANHEAVREGVLDALQEGFHAHGANTKTIRAIYEKSHNQYNPRVFPDELQGCDALAFYVANWTWDIAMYMYFANIWVTDVAMTKKIAAATYQAGAGPSKWINAREKILELVDEMYQSVGNQDPVAFQQVDHTVSEKAAVTTPTSDGANQIRALQILKGMFDEGLINESEYAAKKKEILDSI